MRLCPASSGATTDQPGGLSTAPNSASCSVVSTRWSPDCLEAANSARSVRHFTSRREVAAAAGRERSSWAAKNATIADRVHRHRRLDAVTSRPPADVVKLLNKFFALIRQAEIDPLLVSQRKFERRVANHLRRPRPAPCPEDKALKRAARRQPIGWSTRNASARRDRRGGADQRRQRGAENGSSTP